MAIICDICGDRVGEGISKVMVLNEDTDRWFHLCGTCQYCIILYATKDLPKMRKEVKSKLDELSKEKPNGNSSKDN